MGIPIISASQAANNSSLWHPESIYVNPVRQFFEFMRGMFDILPDVIQALIGMVLGVVVFFGIMQMIRT